MKIALIGTGLLGSGMVQNLRAKGHEVRVWNRTASKAAALQEVGASIAASPAEAVQGAERVHLVLTADDAVDAVLAAAGESIGAGVPVFDHSTNLPERVAARAADLRGRGIRYIHAPVFMAPANARDATGLMLLAADAADAAMADPLLAEMTGKVWHVGERPDLAAVYKLLGNALLVCLSGAFGDLFAMGAEQGLSAEDVLAMFEVWRPGGMLPYFGKRVAAKGTNPVSWELQTARKDVRLMIESAGGPQGLVVLPALAAAMDRAIEAGHAQTDYAVYAWPRETLKAD